jgi:autotransporter-associated beta strand protein
MKTQTPPAPLLASVTGFLIAFSGQLANGAPNVTHVLQSTGISNLTSASWTNGTPGSGTAGDLIQYNLSTAASLNLDDNLTIGVIKEAGSGAFTINSGSGTLTMDATGLTAGNLLGNPGIAFIGQSGVVAGTITIVSPVTLVTDLDIGATASGSSVSIDGEMTATNNQNLNFRAHANVTLNGNAPIGAGGGNIAIANLGIGSGTTTLSGALGPAVSSVTQNSATSALTLSGANSSFSGPVNLQAGTLNLGNPAALGSGVLTIGSGATLNTSGGAQALSTNNLQQWTGTFTYGGSADMTFGTGAITLSNNITVTVNGQTLQENGPIGDGVADHSLTKSGAGTLVLAAANTCSGATIVDQGTLVLSGNNSHSGATTVAGGAILKAVANGGNTAANISSALSAGSGLTLTSSGVAPGSVPDLQLRSDSDTSFPTGPVTPNGVAGNVAIVGSVQGAAATVDVNQATAAGANKILTIGDVVIDNTVASVPGNTVLNVTGGNGCALRIGALLSSNRGPNGQGATFSLNPTTADLFIGSITGSTENGSTVTFTGSATTTVTGSISQGLTGNRGITVALSQTGKVDLNGANTNGTGFAINRGITVLNHNSALGAGGGAPTLGTTTASANNATLLLGGTNVAGTDGGITLSRPISVRNTDSGVLTIGGQNSSGTNFFAGTITLGATTNVGKSITLVAASGGEVVFEGPIVKNGTDTSAGITVGGGGNSGIVTLVAPNTYAGPTQVAGGSLFVDSPGSIAAGNSVTVAAGAVLGGSGTINGPVSAAGIVAPGRGIGTLTTGPATISGTLEVEIDGTNTDVLVSTGNLNFTGATLAVLPTGSGLSNPPYVIAQGAGITGHFANIPPGYVVDYSATQVTLIAPSGDTYATWATARGIPGEPPSGDFDNDDLTNLQEYSLNTDPRVSSTSPGTFVNGLLTFNKGGAAALNGDVSYTIETTTTLGAWTAVAPATNDLNTISYQMPLTGPRRFARLKVTLIP